MKVLSCTLAAALVGLFAASAAAVPRAELGLRLKDLDGNLLTTDADGKYEIVRGQQFQVVLTVDVTEPYYTDSFRTPYLDNRPLGIQVLATNIITPNSAGCVVPVGTVVGNPPKWVGYKDLTPDGFGFPFVNAVDTDKDGDRDLGSVGFFNPSMALSVNADARELRRFQYGLDRSLDGIVDSSTGGPFEIAAGFYQVMKGDSIELRTDKTTVTLYHDPINLDPTAVRSQLGVTQEGMVLITPASGVFISVLAPEPASTLPVLIMGLIAVGRTAYRPCRRLQ